MMAKTLIRILRKRGVKLRVSGNQLRFSAPTGAITWAYYNAMLRYKAELIAILESPEAEIIQLRDYQ
jgi:hypothetical protein